MTVRRAGPAVTWPVPDTGRPGAVSTSRCAASRWGLAAPARPPIRPAACRPPGRGRADTPGG